MCLDYRALIQSGIQMQTSNMLHVQFHLKIEYGLSSKRGGKHNQIFAVSQSFRFSSRLQQRLWVILSKSICPALIATAHMEMLQWSPCQHFHYKPSWFECFVTLPEEGRKKKKKKATERDETWYKCFQLGSSFLCCNISRKSNQSVLKIRKEIGRKKRGWDHRIFVLLFLFYCLFEAHRKKYCRSKPLLNSELWPDLD